MGENMSANNIRVSFAISQSENYFAFAKNGAGFK